MGQVIYLASVYSLDSDEELREKRYQYVLAKTAELSKAGLVVISPIVHSHPMAVHHNMPKTWDFWEKIDRALIDVCSEVWVLKMDGWEKSTGVTAEVAYAQQTDKPVKYLEAYDSPPRSCK